MPQGDRSSAAAGRPGTAPGDLEKVRALVNSSDLEEGTDDWASAAGLASWLERHGLAPAGGPAVVSRTELEQAAGLREALRDVLRAHATAPSASGAPGSVAELRRIAAGLVPRFEVTDDGRIGLEPTGSCVPGALARILLIAADAATAGTWPRLKACAADDCQWAFYDRSPARTGCWCSMRVCGARAKSRAYRQRASGAGRPAPGRPAPGGSAPGGSAPVRPDAAPTARSSHDRTAR
jgi:predicted RNA-binding Zn ribbon-like protein